MAVFYTNVTLLGPTQGRVIKMVRRLGRRAYVSPVIGGCVVLWDEGCEDGKEGTVEWLTTELSRRFGCFAFGVVVLDDDVLWYVLYRDGNRLDTYDSCPRYGDGHRQPPEGGDATALSSAFGVPAQAVDLEQLLRRPSGSATGIHRALARTLGLPPCAVGFGWDSLEDGEEPEGVEMELLRRVTPRQV